MAKTKQTTKLLGNEFSLTGKVNYIDIKRIEKTGTAIARVLISKKGKDDEYDSFGVDLFGDVAEEITEKIKKGDFVNITGKLDDDSYEKDGKKISKLRLIGFSFVKARYDEEAKSYVADASEDKELPW